MDFNAVKRAKTLSGSSTYAERNNPFRQKDVEKSPENERQSSSNGSRNSSHELSIVTEVASVAGVAAPIYAAREHTGNRDALLDRAASSTSDNEFRNDTETTSTATTPLMHDDLNSVTNGNHNIPDGPYEVDPDNLIITANKLGGGHFGDVFVGLLVENDGKQVPVAVKKSKMATDPKLTDEQRTENFRQQKLSLECEIKIMSNMGSHPNILRLIGAVTRKLDYFCIITEYCSYGSLDKFLQEKEYGEKFVNEYIIHGTDGYQLPMSEFYWQIEKDITWKDQFEARRKDGMITTSDLMWFGLQIAQAMEFLTKQSILHRDIALRNVLLADNYIVKVADFGLSRKIVGEIYQPSMYPAMPIGYLAPEVLQYSQFSDKSESWAYGIVLWELFTLAIRQPYLKECGTNGVVHGCAINAFLGAGKRLSVPEIAPMSIRRLISQLWSMEPAKRPDFEKSQSMILKDLKIANPQLAELAKDMPKKKNNNVVHCSNSSDESEFVVPYQKFENKAVMHLESIIGEEKVTENRTSQLRRVLCLCCFPSLLLSVLLGFLVVQMLSVSTVPSTTTTKKTVATPTTYQGRIGVIAARWSWSFTASEIFNANLNDPVYGRKGGLRLGSSPHCSSLIWQPYFEEKGNGMIPFLLQYVEGPPNQRAWRSMLLLTGDGREVMVGNDFHRNHDGFIYNTQQSDAKTFALNLTHISNLSDNDVLTLKIEVFVDPTKSDCEYKKDILHEPINYIDECERLPTNTKLYLNGSCYVGSNTPSQFAFTSRFCNDIPSAAVSRLAWIESETLLNKLRGVMKIHRRTGEQENPPYYIGAKYFSENGDSSEIKRWQWIDSDLQPKRSIPENVLILKKIMNQHKTNHDYAVIFKDQNTLSAVTALEWFHYLCEYRDQE